MYATKEFLKVDWVRSLQFSFWDWVGVLGPRLRTHALQLLGQDFFS